MATSHNVTALLTLVKREYQENRLVFLWLPLAFTVLLQLYLTAGLVEIGYREPWLSGGAGEGRGGGAPLRVFRNPVENLLVASFVAGPPPAVREETIQEAYELPMTLIATTYGFMLLYYFLMTLYRQRQNRSILFWSSMPVSNAQCVASKLLAGYVVAGTVYLLCALVAQLQLMISISIFGWIQTMQGSGEWTLMADANIFSRFAAFAVFLVLGMLWALPVHGGLLLASAWAKRAPFAWAMAGPLVVITFELLANSFREPALLVAFFSHLLPQHFLAYTLPEIQDAVASWELLFSVLLGGVFIALAIHFNRVDE